MTDEHAAIDASVRAARSRAAARERRHHATVLVQSAASDDDTDYMFELVERRAWVGGIVAWCRLDDAASRAGAARRARTRPKFRGDPPSHPPGARPALAPARRGRAGARAARGARARCSSCRRSFPTTSTTSPSSRARYPGLHARRRPPRQTAARDRRDGAGGRRCCEQRPRARTSIAKVSGLNTMVRGRQLGRSRSRAGGRAWRSTRSGPGDSCAAATGRSRF